MKACFLSSCHLIFCDLSFSVGLKYLLLNFIYLYFFFSKDQQAKHNFVKRVFIL